MIRGTGLIRGVSCLGGVRQAQVKVDVCSLKEDIGKLRSQIVESPEELKAQMEKMRENVKNIKNNIVSRKEKHACLQTPAGCSKCRLPVFTPERDGRAHGGDTEQRAECDPE